MKCDSEEFIQIMSMLMKTFLHFINMEKTKRLLGMKSMKPLFDHCRIPFRDQSTDQATELFYRLDTILTTNVSDDDIISVNQTPGINTDIIKIWAPFFENDFTKRFTESHNLGIRSMFLNRLVDFGLKYYC